MVWFKTVVALRHTVVDTAVSRLTRYGGNRHCLYLRSDLVNDSAFPFAPSDEVIIRIDQGKLVIEKAD
jgi:hypothetical protein